MAYATVMGKILWLASYPKAGNTWVRAFLQGYATDTAPDINALAAFSISEAARGFFAPFGSTATENETQKLRPRVHASLAARDRVVLVKTHNANLEHHGTPLCTPAVTGGAVYIVRDPRDVALSFAAYTGKTIDETIGLMGHTGAALEASGEQVFEYLSSWSVHVESWVAHPNRLLVRYEDLLAAPDKYFARILRYLGTTPEPARLARAVGHCDFGALSAQEKAHRYKAHFGNSAFFRVGLAGQWQEALSAAQQAHIMRDHGAIMTKFGYL
jgi:hypothetical protein